MGMFHPLLFTCAPKLEICNLLASFKVMTKPPFKQCLMQQTYARDKCYSSFNINPLFPNSS